LAQQQDEGNTQKLKTWYGIMWKGKNTGKMFWSIKKKKKTTENA